MQGITEGIIKDNTIEVKRVAAMKISGKLIEAAEVVMGYIEVFCPVKTGDTVGSRTYLPKNPTDFVLIGVQTYYAPYLEAGTWKMAPRPFLVPALLSSHSRIKEIFSRR